MAAAVRVFLLKGHGHRCRVSGLRGQMPRSVANSWLTLKSKQSMFLRVLHLVEFRNPGVQLERIGSFQYITKH